MNAGLTREEALALLKKYNKDPFHIQHAFTVEAVMKWYAQKLGYGEEAEFWGIVGLLHDIDFELYPAEHCLKAPEMWCNGGGDSRCGLPRLWHYRRVRHDPRCGTGA